LESDDLDVASIQDTGASQEETMRRFFVIPILLLGLVATSAPAGAVSEQFFEVPFEYAGPFPNPCTGEEVIHTFTGTIYVHQVVRGDRVHINEHWQVEGSSTQGFHASMKATDTYNFDDDRFVAALKGIYQFRNDAGDKYRFRGILHVTEHGDDVIVEFEKISESCVGR
jgi:hypothetical protein